jgi:UDP-N-acetylmuramoyl-L-alanyl-D-glutamate--2,6-diaminopimelate ligase
MKQKNLKYLLCPWIKKIPNKNIINLTLDSRTLNVGDIFIAIPGTKQDGRNFINDALQKKAAAILCETDKKEKHGTLNYIRNIPIICFFQLSKNISILANRFYGQPDQEIKIIGVTGTNGKTTVVQLINQWSTILGEKIATMGTLGNGFYNFLTPSKNTTSSAVYIPAFLSKVLKKN